MSIHVPPSGRMGRGIPGRIAAPDRIIAPAQVRLEFAAAHPSRPEVLTFLRYWATRHPGGGAPAVIAPLLPNTYLAERAEGDWRFSVFGSALVERLGADPTGHAITDILPVGTADALAHLFNGVVWRRAATAVAGRWSSRAAPEARFEAAHVPLTGRDRAARLVFGCIAFVPDPHTA